MEFMKKVLAIILLLSGVACSSSAKKEKFIVEQYPVAYRQLPPEPVYSRFAWAHLPGPAPIKVKDNAPLLMPEVSFELHRSNLEEAIQSLAQTIGYTWSYPADVAKKTVSMNMVAPVDEILQEIEKQTGVKTILDHDNRILRVIAGNKVAELPK